MTATLKELKRAGSVTQNDNGALVARARDYMPGERNPAAPAAVARSGSVLEDIGNTIVWNLARGELEIEAMVDSVDSDGNTEFDDISASEFFATAEGRLVEVEGNLNGDWFLATEVELEDDD